MRYLTKSRFTTAVTCPTKLRYLDDDTYPSTKSDDEFLKALAEGGHQVGALAKCLFPEGFEVDAVGHDAQVAQTDALLAGGDVTLFEAAIRVGRLFIRADVLRKRDDLIELFEVKAKSFDSREGNSQIVGKKGGLLSDFKPYLFDVAFQRHVLRLKFPTAVIRSFLILPDKAAVSPVDGLAQRLVIRHIDRRHVQIDIDPSLRDGDLAQRVLHVLPVDDFVDLLVASPVKFGGSEWLFADGIGALEAALDGVGIAPVLGAHCRKCEFQASAAQQRDGLLDGRTACWSAHSGLPAAALAAGTVFDLYDFRALDTVMATGKLLLSDVTPQDLSYKTEADKLSPSHRRWLQCEESRHAVTEPVVVAVPLAARLAGATYPLHFVDFETSSPALPFHVGRRPYELLLFQFSHHRRDADGSIRHANQHLDTRPGVFPNFDAVRALAKALGHDRGSVVHWWTHERTVLLGIRTQLLSAAPPPPDHEALIAFIDSLVGTDDQPGRLLDLGQKVVLPLAFFTGTRGSSSIKQVLPALLANSPRLQAQFSAANYGGAGGIPSLNFQGQTWVQRTAEGVLIDPYDLLGTYFDDAGLDGAETDAEVVADGGAAMVAYGLLQSDLLHSDQRARLERQLLRYCELDTLAMVMAWLGLEELLAAGVGPL